MKTPSDKQIVLTIYSHPVRDIKLRWKAHLTFKPGSTDDTPAEIDVVDGVGDPIASAVFEFAGQSLLVRDGRAAIRCGDFVKGKHEGAIWLHRKEGVPVPGALTFE